MKSVAFRLHFSARYFRKADRESTEGSPVANLAVIPGQRLCIFQGLREPSGAAD